MPVNPAIEGKSCGEDCCQSVGCNEQENAVNQVGRERQAKRADSHRPEAEIKAAKAEQITDGEQIRVKKTGRPRGRGQARVVDVGLTDGNLVSILKVDVG